MDVLTYDKTRVKLVKGVDPKKNPVCDYINATFVNTPIPKEGTLSGRVGDAKLIACYGPKFNSVNAFW